MFKHSEKDKDDNNSKLERIYIKYKSLMFKEAYNILYDVNDAEDALQQAFLKLMNYMDKIREDEIGMTCNFLKIVVRNIAKDIYRKRLYLNNREDTIDTLDEVVSGQSNEVSDLVIDKESVQRIVKKVLSLPEHYRDIILLEKIHGYTREDTMKLFDTNYETLKKRMTRAKNKLLEALRKEGLSNGRENIRKNVK